MRKQRLQLGRRGIGGHKLCSSMQVRQHRNSSMYVYLESAHIGITCDKHDLTYVRFNCACCSVVFQACYVINSIADVVLLCSCADGKAFAVWRSILVPEAERDSSVEHLQLQLQRLRSSGGAATTLAGHANTSSPAASHPADASRSSLSQIRTADASATESRLLV